MNTKMAQEVTAPYYEDDHVTLYHGDCRKIMPQLAESFDIVITDPPYNVGKDYGPGFDDQRSDDAYAAWSAEWFSISRSLCQRHVVFPGHGNLPMWYSICKPAAVGCWYKPGNSASSIIGFEEWEPWLYWHGGNKGLLGGSSVIKARLETGSRLSQIHPCPKPGGLMSQLILKCRGFSVLDPFAGSGTTLTAAKFLGRKAVGIELNERYCELAAERLSQGVLDFLDFADVV